MPIEKIRETVEYYNTCATCGEEFQLYSSGDTNTTCYKCRTDVAVGSAKEKLLDFIGAKVTCIEPVRHGSSTSDDELEFIEIELADGRRILFSVAGWEDHYIQWEIRNPS